MGPVTFVEVTGLTRNQSETRVEQLKRYHTALIYKTQK